MANIFTKIQRKVNQGLFSFETHFLNALADENFEVSDALQIIYRPLNYFAYDNDESHTRYAFEGQTEDGRILRVILFLSQDKVRFKTAYEIFEI